MQQFQPRGFSLLPVVVKNLLILNGIFFLATFVFAKTFNIDLVDYLGMHYFSSPLFRPYQLVTYMFMHDPTNFGHIIFNMFALWMFGNAIENFWGPKRFLTYYMITGIGAILIQMLVVYVQILHTETLMNPADVSEVASNGYRLLLQNQNYVIPEAAKLNMLYNTTTIGASGAVFGLLLAFGMMFPNSVIYLYFAIPVKAKWFVLLYGAAELFFGVRSSIGDNVAHFAHLGGMLFGFILIRLWKIRRLN